MQRMKLAIHCGMLFLARDLNQFLSNMNFLLILAYECSMGGVRFLLG